MLLHRIDPTPEQRKIFFLEPNKPVLLSGRAGSGKTTTAILRAAQLAHFYKRQRMTPRVGFFVFTNALKTYLDSLAKLELQAGQYEVWTLDLWCRTFLDSRGLLTKKIADETECKASLREAIHSVGLGIRQPSLAKLGEDFLIEEVNYLLGRFGLDTYGYITSDRIGRGPNPDVTFLMKRALATELIPAYQYALESKGLIDWNQMRYEVLSYLTTGVPYERYEIVIIDEAQDLCALQVRIALQLVMPETNAITFIKDATQRIYKNDYIWQDVDVEFGRDCCLELQKNFRNTKEIAEVAASLMRAISQQDDIDILEPSLTYVSGPRPSWARGRYTDQKNYLKHMLMDIPYDKESVGILHIQRKAIEELKTELTQSGFSCVLIQPDDSSQYSSTGIFLSTLHSAKGLEFDHVFIIGYDEFFAPGAKTLTHRETSAHLFSHRKLFYTAITRARKTLRITSSLTEHSRFLDDIDSSLFNIVDL